MTELKTYILKNEYLEVHILNYGGIIDKIYCADKLGRFENVVLSYQEKQDYIRVPGPYLNALVGPVAGRITGGKYQNRTLSKNDGENHLHGGFHGISFDTFEMHQISSEKLQASLKKEHNEDGYQGLFDYRITYQLDRDRLVLLYDVSCTKPNLLYLTSHLYFNLSGDLKETIENQTLCAGFKKMLYVDQSSAPCQITDIVEGSCFDFSNGRVLGEVLSQNHPQFEITRGIDHPFFVSGIIRLSDEKSGRILDIQSDAPCAVLYSANFIDESMTFQNGIKGCKHLGLAIELQDYPNGIHLGLGGERTHYSQQTSYRFYQKK